MQRLLKYITNIRALQFFQLFRSGILFLISIVLTKANPFTGSRLLTLGEIGNYELFILIAGSVSFFWINGMIQSMLSSYKNNTTFSDKEKNPVFFNITILFTILGILAAMMVFVFQGSISKILDLSEGKIPYINILFLYIIVSCPSNLIEYIYLLKNKPLRIIVYGIIVFTLQLFSITMPILLGYGLKYGLYGLVCVNVIKFIWLYIIVFKYSEIKLSKLYIKEFIKLSSPLVLSLLIGGSAKYIDSFLVKYKFDEATLAIFMYGIKEIPFFALLTAAFGNAMTPKFSNPVYLKEPLLELKKGTTRLMHYLFPISFIVLLTSKFLFPLIFNENFTDSASVFNIYVLLMIIHFLFVQSILVGFKETKIIFIGSIIELLINVTLSIIFINFWGIEGVAIATIISYIINKIFLITYLKRKYKIKLSYYLNLKLYYFYVICLILCFSISCFIN